MADFMEVVKGRRSIRKYKEDEVPDEGLDRVLEAVRWSPSWANFQIWEVVVVKDRAVKKQVQETVPSINPAIRAVGDAPVLLVVCGKTKTSGFYSGQATTKFGDWFMFDLGIATQSLCLAAHDQGLGTVIVGLFDHNRVKEILGLPKGFEAVALIPLGYPAKEGFVTKRREISDFTHYDRF